METSLRGKTDNIRGSESGEIPDAISRNLAENICISGEHNETGWEEEAEPVGSNRRGVPGERLNRPRPATHGGSLRQSIAASKRKLAEFAIEKENLRSRLELLDLQEQNENLNVQEKQALLSAWEDNVSAIFPVNNQDANTTT